MTPQEIIDLRSQFPSLNRTIYNHRLVYLDNAATTQSPQCVIDAIVNAEKTMRANVHRGVHTLAQDATAAQEQARSTFRQFINANSNKEIIFTSGTTDSINLVASSLSNSFENDDEIIVSVAEHHSNIVPWQLLNRKCRIHLRPIPLLPDGQINLEAYQNLFTERTRFVSVAHVSNVLGTINPIEKIIRIAHDNNVPILIDGAQAAGHIPIDVKALDCDFYAFSTHKMYGPTGIGILYGKEELLSTMKPHKGGGAMIDHVSFDKTTFADLPYKFEAGTPNFIGISAAAKAVDFIQAIGIENIMAHERNLLSLATAQISRIDNIRIFGSAPEKNGVLSFLIGNEHPYDIGMLLDKLGIAVRTGHHCAQPLMDFLGITGTVRASFAVYNTIDDVEAFISALERVSSMLA